jgi:transcriptional regulator with XRE-family HTH domain
MERKQVKDIGKENRMDSIKLAKLMKKKGINALQLARVAKVDKGSVSMLVRGKSKNPKVDTAAKIAAALDTSIESLLINDVRERIDNKYVMKKFEENGIDFTVDDTDYGEADIVSELEGLDLLKEDEKNETEQD